MNKKKKNNEQGNTQKTKKQKKWQDYFQWQEIRLQVSSMIYQKRTTFKFDCPDCSLELEVTHLMWSALECLHCKAEFEKEDVILK